MTGRAHVFVSGRVQGVFFRADTRDKACELGLMGWVRNLSDGRVEAVFEGEEDKIKEMVEWCRRGPRFASVSGVDVEEEEPTGEFRSFKVKY